MNKKPRKNLPNYAFIDSQNLNLGVRSLGWELDFRKFRVYLRNKYNVDKAFLFIGRLPGNERLYNSLHRSGYNLIFKPTLQVRKGKEIFVKGNVDAELVLHTMIEWNNFDKALIVSGDGDFHCLIKYLVKQKKLLKVIAPNDKYSSLLREFNKGHYIQKLKALKKSLQLVQPYRDDKSNRKSNKQMRGIRGRSKP